MSESLVDHSSEPDSAFDQDKNETNPCDKEYKKANQDSEKMGLADGMAEGRDAGLQKGFNQGFKEAFELVENLSIWRGFVKGLSTSLKNDLETRPDEKKELYALYGKLLEYEQQLIAQNTEQDAIREQMSKIKGDISALLEKMGMSHLLDSIQES